MAEIHPESKTKEIYHLLIVFGLGIVAAFFLALWMLYYYNPSGSYLAKNVLLSPENVQSIKFNELNPATGEKSKFIFGEIEFSYFAPQNKHWNKKIVSMDQYQVFYQAIANEKSVKATDQIRNLFHQSTPSTLLIKIRPERAENASKNFIEVNFANEGDFYRIELHEQNTLEPWAYFYHSGIYQMALKIFSS